VLLNENGIEQTNLGSIYSRSCVENVRALPDFGSVLVVVCKYLKREKRRGNDEEKSLSLDVLLGCSSLSLISIPNTLATGGEQDTLTSETPS